MLMGLTRSQTDDIRLIELMLFFFLDVSATRFAPDKNISI